MHGLRGSLRQREVYEYSLKNPLKTPRRISTELNLSLNTVRRYIQLEKKNLQ